MVMRRAGGAQSPTRSPTQPSRRFGLPLRTPPDTGPSIARRIEKFNNITCKENEPPSTKAAKQTISGKVEKPEKKSNESSSQAAYMEELQLAVKMRAARMETSQTSCCMDAGDNAACQDGRCSTVPSLPEVPSII